MTLLFDGRVAIVTGAGSGLGREHALLLGKRGASVIVNDVAPAGDDGTTPAQRVVEEITADGGAALADRNSVSTPEGGEAIVTAALESFGGVDIVVNNAGIVRDKTFGKLTAEMVDPVLDVHLRGAFHVAGPAYRVMRDKGYGRIISTTSAAGLFGNFGQANYGAAKMGLVGLTRVLAIEGAKYGIKANVVAPIAATAMSAGLLDNDWENRLKPELVSPAVAFLAHDSCPVTGEILSAAAGRVAKVFVAETQGYYSPDLTVEDVAEQWATICDEDHYAVPHSAEEERDVLASMFK